MTKAKAHKAQAETRAVPDHPGIRTSVIRVDPRELKLLELNPRYMKSETYQALVRNVKRDRALTQIPFAWKIDDGWEVLSGNHRVMAAIDAGLPEIDLQVTEDSLTPDQRRAIQISHNALVGEDDPAILKQLYEEIGDLDWRQYAGLDDKTLGLLEDVTLEPLGEANLDYTTVSLVFLPDELETATKALQDARSMVKPDRTWLAPFTAHNAVLDALSEAGDAGDVTNVATQLLLILRVFDQHRTELAELWDVDDANRHTWVPLSTILGGDRVPIEVARKLKQAVERIAGQQKIAPHDRWKVLEVLAAEHLAHG